MLRKATDLVGSTIHATDGDIGSISTVYFDDDRWTVRYFVVDTGGWLPGRKVLISPLAIRQASAAGRRIDTSLTREQVKNSPGVDTERPVSRQHEIAYSDYYRYPYYWAGPGVWGAAALPPPNVAPAESVRAAAAAGDAERAQDERNSHLRDVSEVRGYHIHASDGSIGHADEFLIDNENWTIRYLVIDTSNWIGGRRVLISPTWVTSIRWEAAAIGVGLTRDAIRRSPEYDPSAPVERVYEERLHTHYAQPPYWRDADARTPAEDAHRDRFARLDELRNLEVADGDTDVRGWTVVASDGVPVGRVEHLIVDRPAMKVQYLEADVEPLHESGGTRDVLIPLEYVDIIPSAREVRLQTVASARVPALPAFRGLPIDPDFAARCRMHFMPHAGSADRHDRPEGRP